MISSSIRKIARHIFLAHCGGEIPGFKDGQAFAYKNRNIDFSVNINQLAKEMASARLLEGSIQEYQIKCYISGFQTGYNQFLKDAFLSELPTSFVSVTPTELDREILRASMIAELDAISLYEQMAAATKNEKVRKVLLDVAREEETHVGEFHSLLSELDTEYANEIQKGNQEVEELVGV